MNKTRSRENFLDKIADGEIVPATREFLFSVTKAATRARGKYSRILFGN